MMGIGILVVLLDCLGSIWGQTLTTELCKTPDSCVGITSIDPGTPCGTPCGACVTSYIDGRPSCRQCRPNHFLNKTYQCEICRGTSTNKKANVRRSCRDSIDEQIMDKIDQIAINNTVNPENTYEKFQNTSHANDSQLTILVVHNVSNQNVTSNESRVVPLTHANDMNATVPEDQNTTARTTSHPSSDSAEQGDWKLVIITGGLIIVTATIFIVIILCL